MPSRNAQVSDSSSFPESQLQTASPCLEYAVCFSLMKNPFLSRYLLVSSSQHGRACAARKHLEGAPSGVPHHAPQGSSASAL